MKDIWSVVLAAGESKRMGFPKMLLDFNGSTMIGKVIDTIIESEAGSILVVLGAERESIIEILSGYKINTCYNEHYKDGMLSSVQCGIRNVPANAGAVLVFQGDQPLIKAQTINAIIDAYRTTGRNILIPVNGGRRGHPVLIGMKYREEIYTLNAKIGLRELMLKNRDDILEVETSDQGILRDFDTYEEYRNEINKFR
ncbi:MAG TPA: nucleotidyltransferase family protein [Bacteroidales bacterium]|nr:nucleotidyltransferase family protein [Bacteroidales bacterium]